MKRFTLIVISVVLAAAMLASCTQYRVIWIPGMDDQNTPSTSQSAKDTFSLIDALDEQLPGHIESVMKGDFVHGLTRTDIVGTTSIASRSSNATYSATFSFNEYPVAGYGTIKTGTLTVNFQGTKTTDGSSNTTFTADTSKMDFTNLSVLKTNETVATPVEIKNLEGSSTAVITTDSTGKVTVEGLAESLSIKQSISSSTTITVDNVNVPAKDVADSNTSGDFASGLGNEAYPYIINTTEQFEKIGSEKAAYYKLGNNITLPSDLQIYAFYGRLSVASTDVEEFRASKIPPTFFAYGTRDPFYRQFQACADAVREAGVEVEEHEYEGMPHGFGYTHEEWMVSFDSWMSRIMANN